MKYKIKEEKGITMVALIVTVIILLIVTSMLIYNAKDSIYINALTDLYNDIELLNEKVSEYYNEYGKIPAKIKYTNTNTSQLSSVLSKNNDTGDFYVIDLEAMKGITLNYGKDYEKIKNDENNSDDYTDVYIINENSHNIFYVKGISIQENDQIKIYYTNYTEPDETTVDLRYIDGIIIPQGYYYIGKTTESNGNTNIVISKNKNEEINTTSNQYIWQKQISNLEKVPDSIKLGEGQNETEFLKSVNNYKGYFKNKNKTTEIDVVYITIDEEKWSEAYTKETKYTDINGETVSIPKGCKISMAPTMNQIKNGFVIKDSNNNEWVWVQVPKTVYKTATSNTDYDKMESDLIEYTKDYRKEGYKDEWYAIDGSNLVTASTEGLTEQQKELNNGCGLTYSEYNETYKKMLESIYVNEGFWIGRYEVGDKSSTDNEYSVRTNASGATGTPVIIANQVPYDYVTCSQAQVLSNKLSIEEKTSSLIFGIQWDLTCKFLEVNSDLELSDISVNSTEWGNYKNNSLKLERGRYNIAPESASGKWKLYNEDTTNYVTSSITSDNANYFQLYTTGASYESCKLNIYDFAGNEWEWTLEKTSSSAYPCSHRSGCYANNGFDYQASCHYYGTNYNKAYGLAFRATMY